MEGLVALLVLFLFAVWLAPLIISLMMWSSARGEIRRLEARLDDLELAPTAPSAPPRSVTPSGAIDFDRPPPEAPFPREALDLEDLEEELPTEEVTLHPSEESRPRPTTKAPFGDTPPPKPPRAAPSFEAPSLEKLVVWTAAGLGGLAAVIAALLALVAAMDRGWVGPAARVSTGLALGIGLWVGAARSRHLGHRAAASALAGAGIGTLYGSLFAASGLYGLIPTPVASVAMVTVTAVAAGRAVGHHDRFVAWLALFGGVLTPVLVSTGEGDPLTLFAYLAVLSGGFVAAACRRGWWDVIAGSSAAVGLLHVTWTASAHQPENIGPALAGVAMLVVPPAAAAALLDRRLHLAGAIGAAGLAGLALPWIVPVAPQFIDPITGEVTARSQPLALALAAVATSVLGLPLVAAGRFRGHRLAGIGGGIVTAVLALTFAAGWADAFDTAGLWLAWGAVGGALLGAVGFAGSESGPRAFLPALGAAAIALAMLTGDLTGPELATGTILLMGAGVVVVASTGWGVSSAVAGLAVALPLVVADPGVVDVAWLAGLAAASLALTSQGPVVYPWRRADAWAYGGAAVASIVLFIPLYRCWVEGFGTGAVGLLPLLLGANALVGVLTLIRRGLVIRQETATAVFVATVLLGIAGAVPLQLEERWLTVVWALEAAGLAWAHRQLRHPILEAGSVLLCIIVGIRLVLNPWALGWGTAAEGWPVLNWTLYSWGVPLVSVLLVGRWLPRLVVPAGALAALIGFALVNVEVSHGFQDAGPLELSGVGWLQGAVRSASWAGYGLIILGIGLAQDARWVRLVGFGFVLLATFKVFGVDLWDLSGFARVGSLGCLAVSLLIAALLFERLVLRGVSRTGGQP